MKRKQLAIIVGVIAIGLMLSYGIFAYPFSVLSPSGGHQDNLKFVDNVTIKVFNPDGTLARVWQSHNDLQGSATNGIVGCITGASTAPANYGSCDSWISGIDIEFGSSSTQIYAAGTNTPFAGSPGTACTPSTGNAPPGAYCTGWTTTALFGDTTFTPTNCPTTCTVDSAQAANAGGTFFDNIITSIAVAPGDSLSVTITFNVS